MFAKINKKYITGSHIIIFAMMLFAVGLLFGMGVNASQVVVNYNYTGALQTVQFGPGTYQLEVWGAQGSAGNNTTGGYGGYAKGNLTLSTTTTLNIYVGGQTGWNGGGTGFNGTVGAGGGASDIRVGGTALSNRVIVAGGGGGGGDDYFTTCNGGAGGGTTGVAGDSDTNNPGGNGGTQSSGYSLGSGQSGMYNDGGGGGGGYYGGYSGVCNDGYYSWPGGGGGSGYIGGVTSGTMSTGVKSGNGLIRITYTSYPVISLSTPTTNQVYSGQTGYKTITITGKLSDPAGDNVTISAAVNGKTKSVVVNTPPTSPPASDNFTLTWDVSADAIAEGTYSGITVRGDDGTGGVTNVTLTPTLTVDLTAPTVNTPTSGSITATSFVGTANASDTNSPFQYLFNLNGADQGTWQSGSTYTFTGLTKNTVYTIKYEAKDAVGNVSAYSGTLSVTTLANAPVTVPAATITEVRDLYNNDNASDIRVIFKGASDESNIGSYKVIVALAGGTQPTDTVGSSLTTLATNILTGNYISESKKGNGRLHIIVLPSKLQTYDNKTINGAAGALKVYVLSSASGGNIDKLSTSGDLAAGLTSNNDGGKVVLSVPTVMDVDNTGTGTDLRVTFKKSQSQMNIQEYRVIVSTIDLTVATAASVPAVGYKSVTPSNVGTSYMVTMGSTQTDNGGVTAIKNGTAYKIYILAVGKNGYANVLSTASKPITLLATVPSAMPVRDFTAVKLGSGHAGSNISVTFSEPLVVTNVQEYRVFICTGAGSLDSVTASGLDNTKYIKVDSTGRGTAHTVTLTGLNNIYDGTALAAGDYKVYVLTVGKTSTYAARLTGPSRIVKLD